MNAQNLSLFILRVSMGWFFFYSGITKVLDSSWTSEAYIKGATLLPDFFAFLLKPDILPIVDLVNEWALVLLGVSLILGVFVRFSGVLGAILMLLYYIAALKFPNPSTTTYIINEHIIYIGALLTLASFHAGKVWGLGNKLG